MAGDDVDGDQLDKVDDVMVGDEVGDHLVDGDQVGCIDVVVSVKTVTNKQFISNLLIINIG
jgi:hypothetical protein